MSRKVAVAWHASFSIAAGVLYFFFVLPRWPELTGATSDTLGTVLRIVTGALIGLAALPVVFTLLRTRKPELGTPQLALTLRTSSIGLHVVAGVLIIGTAISEIWLTLDSAGRWLFGIYGAAAAIALLGVFAFYLSFVAEMPPPPPKPLKPKAKKAGRRGRRKATEAEPTDDIEDTDEAPEAEAAPETEEATADDSGPAETEAPAQAEEQADDKPAEVTAENEDDAAVTETETQAKAGEADDTGDESANGGLRNRRTSGKISLRRRKRSRGGVAVDD
jgi:outer membrane biosynthesis protein TonB